MRILICAVVGALTVSAGTITSATAEAEGLGGMHDSCTEAGLTSTFCSAATSRSSWAASSATSGDRMVSAFIQGGAYFYGNESQASAAATYTETFNPLGFGTGVVTIWESVLQYGTGTLSYLSAGTVPMRVKTAQSFTYGTPFTVALSAVSSSYFAGAYCDTGSLLIEKRLDSVTFSGGMTAAPEPGGWVLAVIGLGLVGVARREVAGSPKAEQSWGETVA